MANPIVTITMENGDVINSEYGNDALKLIAN